MSEPASTPRDWKKLAEHFIGIYFPTLGPHDTIMRDELVDCVAYAMEQATGFELPDEARGDWVPIGDVPMGTRVVAPYNKGIGYMVGIIKMDPYGTGKRVVSNGEGFVTPEAVKMLLQVVKS